MSYITEGTCCFKRRKI